MLVRMLMASVLCLHTRAPQTPLSLGQLSSPGFQLSLVGPWHMAPLADGSLQYTCVQRPLHPGHQCRPWTSSVLGRDTVNQDSSLQPHWAAPPLVWTLENRVAEGLDVLGGS